MMREKGGQPTWAKTRLQSYPKHISRRITCLFKKGILVLIPLSGESGCFPTLPATVTRMEIKMVLFKTQPDLGKTTSLPVYRKLQYAFLAACLILGPLFTILEVVFNPSRSAVGSTGSAVIAANMAANAGMNLWHLLFGMFALFLFPFGTLGMIILAMRRSPWLATIGGFLALTGLFAFIVFAGQEDLSYLMAQMGGGPQLVILWDRFNTDPLMTAYLFIFIIGHLIGPMLLGIGLGRTHVIPAWAAWAIILRTPLQIAGFLTHIGLSIEIATYGLLLLGSIPVALALLTLSDEEKRVNVEPATAPLT